MNTIFILLAVGLLAGFASGLVGIGGGIVIVPALVFFLGMSQHQAQGTTLAMFLLPIGIFGAFNYYKSDYMDIRGALFMSITFMLGSYFGSRFAISIEENMLKKIFGVMMLLVSIKLIFSK
jgi:uncharacterized protein